MGQHGCPTESFGQMMRDPLGQSPRVDEHESRSVSAHQFRDPVVDVLPHLVRRDDAELRLRHVHRQVEVTAVTCVHDAHPGGHTPRGVVWGDAGQKARDLLDRLDRRGQTYALGPTTSGFADEIIETGKREREMRPTLVVDQGVDLGRR